MKRYLIFLFAFVFSLVFVSATFGYNNRDLVILRDGSLNDLTNVDVPSPTNNYVLSFNSTSGNWEAVSMSAVGDTNASTACSGAQLLLGNGTCSPGTFLAGSGVDTNATTACAGSEYLAGNGTCLNVSAVGDTNETTRVNILVASNFYNSTDFSISDYYLFSNPFGFYNSTNPSPDTNISDTDTNASTACSGTEYLAGNGTCLTISVSDTNETARVNILVGSNFYNSTDFSISSYYLISNPFGFYNSTNPSPDTNISDTDTNASTACAGAEYFAGNGTCLNISAVGDTNETARVNILVGSNFYNSTDFVITNYYLKNNPFGFYNITNPSPDTNISDTNETPAVNILQGSGFYNATTFDFNDYYLLSNPYGFLNGTNLADNIVWNFANNDFNISFSAPTSDGINIEGVGAYTGDLVHIHQHTGDPSSTTLLNLHADDTDVLPLNISGTNDNAIITLQNISAGWFTGSVNYSDVQNHPSMTDTNETIRVNILVASSFYNATDFVLWDAPFNATFGTLDSDTQNTTQEIWEVCDNSTFYELSNPFGFYNITNPSPDTNISDTNETSAVNILQASNFYNATNHVDANLTEDEVEAYIFDSDNTANLNMSAYNITLTNGTSSMGRLCMNQACSSYIYHNGTGIVLQG